MSLFFFFFFFFGLSLCLSQEPHELWLAHSLYALLERTFALGLKAAAEEHWIYHSDLTQTHSQPLSQAQHTHSTISGIFLEMHDSRTSIMVYKVLDPRNFDARWLNFLNNTRRVYFSLENLPYHEQKKMELPKNEPEKIMTHINCQSVFVSEPRNIVQHVNTAPPFKCANFLMAV